jgi:vanillate O-demethylase monooxygenase subunit
VALATEVVPDRPHRSVLLGQPWALTRDDDGEVVAVADVCPHRRAPLSAGTVEAGTFRCAYHGWRFDGSGGCAEIPALGKGATLPSRARCMVPAAVTERYGIVWLAPEPPRAPLVELPEWGSAEFPLVQGGATTWRAGAGQMVDNFLDVAHFPFTHLGTFGVADDRVVADFEVRREGWSLQVVHDHDAVAADPSGGAVERRTQVFDLRAPFSLVLRLRYERSGDEITVLFAVAPVEEGVSRLYRWNLRNEQAAARRSPGDHEAIDLAVVEEDRTLLERFDIKTLPLDLRAEVHTKADRATVALRRLLADVCRGPNGPSGPSEVPVDVAVDVAVEVGR